MQPYLFPYLGYYQLIAACDKFIALDDVAFINRGWINRNKILSNEGSQYFTVPLTEASQNRRINQISVRPSVEWRAKLFKKIEFTYAKAPHFKAVFPLVQQVLEGEEPRISDMAEASLRVVCDYLKITTEFSRSSASPSSIAKAEERILELCRAEKAAQYINLIGGRELYSTENFARQNIALRFLRMNPQTYRQFKTDSTEPLSMLDVLMFNDQDGVRERLRDFTLIS